LVYHEADLNVLSGFAQTHGKPTGLGEWGVVITDTGIGGSTNPLFGMGGGDNPGYIQHIYDWMLANGTTHSSHYDENLTSQYHKISPPDNTTRYPLASVRFKDLFG
jgi:hypothetical protein